MSITGNMTTGELLEVAASKLEYRTPEERSFGRHLVRRYLSVLSSLTPPSGTWVPKRHSYRASLPGRSTRCPFPYLESTRFDDYERDKARLLYVL